MGASFGNAFLAACAVDLARPEDIDAWNPVERRVEPVAHPVYVLQYRLFRQLYEGTKDVAHALSDGA